MGDKVIPLPVKKIHVEEEAASVSLPMEVSATVASAAWVIVCEGSWDFKMISDVVAELATSVEGLKPPIRVSKFEPEKEGGETETAVT